MNFFEKFVPRKKADQPESERPQPPDVQPGLQEITPTPGIDRDKWKNYDPTQVQNEIDRINDEERGDLEREKEIDRVIDERDRGKGRVLH